MEKIIKVIFFAGVLISLNINSQQFTVEEVITGLNRPVAFSFMPNGNLIITQQGGLVRIFSQNNQQLSVFWDFTDSCLSVQELGTIGIVLDPNYQNNNYIYIYNVHKIPPIITGTEYFHRITSFVNVNNTGTNPRRLFQYTQAESQGQIHAAGNIYFGKDNKLYFSFGALNAGEAQSLNMPRGKILRINSDGTIPIDNPFYDDGNPFNGNDDRIWALGLRNPFDFCFSPINDSLYAGDNGSGPDEIDFIRKGKNYGYPVCNGICGNPLYKDPILQMPSGTVPTGIIVYNGTQFPSLNNNLLFAASNSGKIYKCILGNSPYWDTIISYTEWVSLPSGSGPTALRQGSDGNIYVCALGSGKILKIKPEPNAVININQALSFSLSQNYPNPFNPVTLIKFDIPKQSFVEVKIYNSLGMELSTLISEVKQAGRYDVQWDGSNYASGVYFYELSAGEFKDRKKMVLVK
ncbi:MAG: protein up-regulated by thyroid hormone-putative PQQ-dependent glucose dehydrogenase [Chlorobi bacterium OLB5]|nr:MAG: protein up-regulated by thyroid hormone-putative PQQ-dependent glucose dehydrogenase [Chlorobi bacterium OLB5]